MVYFVGAGPGDPGLLVVRAAELLRRADLIVADVGVDSRILERARAGAEVVHVTAPHVTAPHVTAPHVAAPRVTAPRVTAPHVAAPRVAEPAPGGPRSVAPSDVPAFLVGAAGRARAVVRLLEGDPFVFGTAGEEARALRAAGVAFEVVPGVTAGLAAAAYAGIPLTPGTGGVLALLAPDPGQGPVAWEHVARLDGTLVVYLNSTRIAELADRLLREGYSPDVPVALIASATTPRQRTLARPLIDIAAAAERAGLAGPAVVVVGEAVRQRELLGWFEARPLFGRRIVVTRARAQAPEFGAALEALGAEVVQFPAIRIEPAERAPLRRAVRDVGGYDWVVFTSVNGVERFWEEMENEGLDARVLGGVRLACIGPATAAALELRGIRPDVVPSTYVAEAVLEAIARSTDLTGARVLLPRAAGARSALPEGLRARGAMVDEVEAYRTVHDATGARELRRRLDAGEIDVVTFTASSTVESFVDALGVDVGRAAVAAIGPITGATARERGLTVDIEANEHTIPGLIRALLAHFDRERSARHGVQSTVDS